MLSNNSQKKQIAFFERIKSSIDTSLSPISEIARVLNVTESSVYRRVRGQKMIDFDEYTFLEEAFLSVNKNEARSFLTPILPMEYSKVSHKMYPPIEQKMDILKELKHADADLSSMLYYCAKDLSIFRMYAFQKLTAFHNYWIHKMVLKSNSHDDKLFNFEEELKSPDLAITDQIAKYYNSISSVEVWGLDSFNSTLYVIADCYRKGYITSFADFDTLLKELKALATQMERDAEKGYKGDNRAAKFNLYQHNLHRYNDFTVIDMHDTKVSYIQQNRKDILMLNNIYFGNDLQQSIENAAADGVCLSAQNAANRKHYFKEIDIRIQLASKIDPHSSSAIVIAGIIDSIN